METSDLKKR